jgi:hypothetical protein
VGVSFWHLGVDLHCDLGSVFDNDLIPNLASQCVLGIEVFVKGISGLFKSGTESDDGSFALDFTEQ